MPLSSIVTVVLRLFALSWFVQALIQLVWVFRSERPLWSAEGGFSIYLPALTYLLFSILLAMWSAKISRLITPKPDAVVQIGGLTSYDLYCFAFVFLGLYFVLSSAGEVINWAYYALEQAQRESPALEGQGPNYYGLVQSLITLLSGAACLIAGPRFARKLAAAHEIEIKAATARPPAQ